MEMNDSARESWPALMEQAQAGDRPAYTRLLKALVPVIRSQVRRQVADDVLTEDVVQDVLLTVHRVRHTYDPAFPFLPWLMAIISARAIDALRRRGRYQQWEIPEETLPEPVSQPNMQRAESQQELEGYLSQLPLRQREIVEHVHLREMSLTEAAAHNHLTVAAVKSLLHRALKNLRRFGANHDRS
ncbi:sigma-70 family RNA polymerase sigma factor [Erwinia sp. S43]|uniref:RNA polymerase subunit sigma-70 n=1 Tax=Pantoea coffeiphila TaxID=1465635 RepID=A0A2S9I9I5_9GAMM|nr:MULTISPECIES: sigma-70 family RNA polymerase sigma factor [Erwiniaceae]MBK0030939.1 sigma-70 family RNA polymerase sigma factor [Erwinia sp. S43]MCW1876328.1 sigma-70 family RNA polymerase sigma factor [Erwinia sp. INIA01]PRD14448.1 RNA polymerase subunit sigma-70 [Pantoea coffeiphila]